MLMLNSIMLACIQQAVHAGSFYVTTTISVSHHHTYVAFKSSNLLLGILIIFSLYFYDQGGLTKTEAFPNPEISF